MRIRPILSLLMLIAVVAAYAADTASTNVVSSVPAVKAAPSVPSAIAPVWREFAAKCSAGTVRRHDLITMKRFIASRKLTDDEKKYWTAEARRIAHAARAKAKEKQ